MTEQIASDTIPVPSDFPITWKNPNDEKLFWQQDSMHFPEPVTPLDFTFSLDAIDIVGFNRGTKAYDIPMSLVHRHINSYLYISMVEETDSQTPPESHVHESEAKLQHAAQNLEQLWNEQWLPEIQENLNYWDIYDLDGASLPDLLHHLSETKMRLERVWEIHFTLFFPMVLAIFSFEEFYQDLFPDATEFEIYELLSLIENHTIQSDLALWGLGQYIQDSTNLRQLFLEKSANDVLDVLAHHDEADIFLNKFNEYLADYGKRSDTFNIDAQSWVEDPTPVIRSLQEYVRQDTLNLVDELATTKQKRLAALDEVREKLQGYPTPIINQFEELLKVAQIAYMLRDDHNYWIDCLTYYHARRVALAFGQRLVDAGVISAYEDVFYFTLRELNETVQALIDNPEMVVVPDNVSQRKLMGATFVDYTPPPLLGTLPSGPPPDNPLVQMFMKIEGAPLPPSESPDILVGNAASSGVVQGIARIVLDPTKTTEVKPGDILIAKSTAPSWTPLFSMVAAVVTNMGGVLCHSAVVAREYSIPAVVGVNMATEIIQDGQRIEVDGDNGIVRILG